MYAQATHELYGPGFGRYARHDEEEARARHRAHGCSRHSEHEGAGWREMFYAMSGGRGPRGGRGHGPWGRGGFGGFGGFPPSGPHGRGRKARRGDFRTAALLLLAERARNGYELMQEVEERSGGVWRPSPGSVYPALQQLEDEGLVRPTEADGRKVYELTEAGHEYLQQRGEGRRAPWEEMSSDFGEKAFELGNLMKEVAFAFAQVMRTGSESQMEEARKVLTGTRKDLYRILADGGDATGDAPQEQE
jgi:DNA-binding PadR family transcriptional regulator